MFNSNMRSPPPELMGQFMYGQPNYFGPSSYMYDTTANLGHTSPPRRRYSIGGLPSASMTDYLNLMQNASESAHLSNLLNETSKSISRSTQILGGRRLSQSGLSSYPTIDNCGDTAFQSDNILNLPLLTNFSSHPNIYSQPTNYNNTATQYFDTNYLSSYQKPLSHSFLYSRPSTYTSTLYPSNLLSSTQLPSQTNTNATTQLLPHQSILSQSRNMFMPSHHASNPALSHSSNWMPHKTTSDTYHHHPFSGYSNQHFDHHYYQVPMSKLDLDYSKQGENKRQVSFKFDVDTLSIDS